MLIARLEYLFNGLSEIYYHRRMEMSSENPDLLGLVVTGQNWKRLEEKDGLSVVQVEESVLEKEGPLSEPFQDPPARRRIYLDACGLMPKGEEEFASLSPLPILSEEPVEQGSQWIASELVPNHALPVDVTYTLSDFLERAEQLVARIDSQVETETLEVKGRYEFSVSRGVLLRGQLHVKNRLPEGQTVSLLVDMRLSD
ncbi:hypothetical protein JST97_00140 [bacterium]|nr:hypothetical protein [bacterium]